MDDHFEQMLAPASAGALNQSKYIPTESFEGNKFGFVFKKGAKGLGYYSDHIQKQPLKVDGYVYQTEDAVGKKRKLGEDNDGEDREEVFAHSVEQERKEDIDRMLDEAEANIEPLDSNSLKQLLLSFEKKITKNLKMRMKHSEEPEKFMESELELHAEINELYSVAASPELYPTFVEAGSVNSILGMITHENTDISIAAVGLLHEMTDVDTILEVEEAMILIDTFLNSQGLELLVQNLSRLDESNDEDAQGVNSSMGCIENLVEIRPNIAVLLCERTHILKFLLLRLKVKKFDANKLYCSEILSILLQSHDSNQVRACHLQGLDGMESILQAVSLYRKKDPSSPDEEECVANLFSSLCSMLLKKENQEKFLACEGMELMVRCINEQKFSAACALRVIKYAVSNNTVSCKKLITCNGLKHIYPILMGRGLPKSKKNSKTAGSSSRDSEETAIAIISQLVHRLHDCQEDDINSRLLNKLTEGNGEKLERCAELCAKYAKALLAAEQQIALTAQALEEGEDEEELEEFTAPENIYTMRLDGGLFSLQQLSAIIIFACINDKKHGSLKKAEIKLEGADLYFEDIVNVLREAAIQLYEKDKKSDVSGDTEEGGNDVKLDDISISLDDKEAEEEREKQRQLYVDWSIAAGALSSHRDEDETAQIPDRSDTLESGTE